MFRFVSIFMLTGALFVMPACKKQSTATDAGATPVPTPTEPGPTTTTDTPAPTPPPTDAPKPTMTNNMANCPSAVAGAATTVTKDADKVIVLITHKEEAAIAEIRKRAKALEGNNANVDSAEVKHTAKGTGSAVLGKCPVALADATAKAEDVDGGSKVTLTPTDKTKLDALFQMAQERAAAPAPSGGAGGDGEGDGHDHGGGGGGGHGGGGGGGGSGDHGGEKKDGNVNAKGTPVPTKEP